MNTLYIATGLFKEQQWAGESMFNTIVILNTFHLKLVEPMDGDSRIRRTNSIPQTGARSCNLRRKKKIRKPIDAKVQNKNREDGKGIRSPGSSLCAKVSCVWSHRVFQLANQRQKQPHGSILLTPKSQGLFKGLNSTTNRHSRRRAAIVSWPPQSCGISSLSPRVVECRS